MGSYSKLYNETTGEKAKDFYAKASGFYLGNLFKTTQEVLDFYRKTIVDNNWSEHDTIVCSHEIDGIVSMYKDGKLLRPKTTVTMVDAMTYEDENSSEDY